MASPSPRASASERPIDRVRAALAMGRADRPPAAKWGHTFREEWSPQELGTATVERQRRFGWDFVKLQPRATCFAEAFGGRYRPSSRDDEGPQLVRPAVRSAQDWPSLPDVDGSAPALADQVEALRLVVEQVGPGVPVLQTLFSPLTVAGYLAGEEKMQAARDLVRLSDVMVPVLDRIARTLVDFGRRSVEAGAAGVFYAISWYASADALSFEEYEELALPSDLSVLQSAAAQGWFNVLHLCGPRLHFELTTRLPAQAVSWSVHEPGNPSLAEGRDRSGRAAMGGLDHARTLVHGSSADVRGQVQAALEETSSAGVLIAPGCSVPPTAPEANLAAMMDWTQRD